MGGEREVGRLVVGGDDGPGEVGEGELDLLGVGLLGQTGIPAPFALHLAGEGEDAEVAVEGDVVVEVGDARAGVEVGEDALAEAEEAAPEAVVAAVAVAEAEAAQTIGAVVGLVGRDDAARADRAAARVSAAVRGVGAREVAVARERGIPAATSSVIEASVRCP
jgi:hypothetical protein